MARVIKELQFGELLDTSFALFKEHFSTLMGIAVRTFLPPFLLVILGGALVVAVPVVGIIVIVVAVIYMALGSLPMAAAGITYAVSSAYLGQPMTASAALEASRPFRSGVITTAVLRGLCLMGLYILAILLVAVGFAAPIVLIVTIPIAIAIFVFMILFHYRTWVTTPIVVVENTVNSAALERSKQLMLGSKGKAFGIEFIIGIAVFVINVVLGLIPVVGQLASIGMSIFQAVFMTVVGVALYFSCRCKHENYDLSMLAQSVQVDSAPGAQDAPPIPDNIENSGLGGPTRQ